MLEYFFFHFKTFIFKFKILEIEKRNQDYEKEIHKLKDELNKQDVRIEALQNELDKMKLKESNYSGRISFLFKKKHLLQLRNSFLKHFKDQKQNQTKKKVILNSLSGLY